MPKPIALETEITKRRIIEELETIEKELDYPFGNSRLRFETAINRVRELRIALETKQVFDSIQ